MSINVVSNIVPEEKVREAQLRGLKIFADAITPTYGPMGGFTGYSTVEPGSKKLAMANYTKDGRNVLSRIQLDKPIEDMLREEILTICDQVVKEVGDGTSSATIASYYIFKGLVGLQKKGYGKRAIITTFKRVVDNTIEHIKQRGRECTIDDIEKIAYTSTNGNAEMAACLREIYEKNGMGAYIDVGISNSSDHVIKTYSGIVCDSGYISPAFCNTVNKTAEYTNPHIYVFERGIDSPFMIKVLSMIIDQEIFTPTKKAQAEYNAGKAVTVRPNAVLILTPTIGRDANAYIDSLIDSLTTVDPVSRMQLCIVSGMSHVDTTLLDIKSLSGAKFIKDYISPEQLKEDQKNGLAPTEANLLSFAGKAEKVIVDSLSTRIINPKMMYDANGEETEFYKQYVTEMEVTLKKMEELKEDHTEIYKLKRRINIIKCNMAEFFIGGIGTSDRNSLRDLVEDATLNCRSAAINGVCNAANYEGFFVLNELSKECRNSIPSEDNKESHELEQAVTDVLLNAYLSIVTLIYKEYFDGDMQKAMKCALVPIGKKAEYNCPFNILSEEFDGNVLTSVMTEPTILDAIKRIILLMFDVNQFLVPDPRFNIYTSSEYDTSIISKEEEGTPVNAKYDPRFAKSKQEEVIIEG